MHTSQIALFEELANLSQDYEKIAVLGRETADKILALYCHYQIAATLSGDMEIEKTLDVLKRLVEKYFRVDQYALLLLDDDLHQLVLRSSFGLGGVRESDMRTSAEHPAFSKAFEKKNLTYHQNCKGTDLPPFVRHSKIKATICLPLLGESGEVLGMMYLGRQGSGGFSTGEIESLQDIGEHAAKVLDKIMVYEHTRELSITDELTRIFNRRYFNQRFEREMQRAIRYKRPLSVIMVDIDYFKKYNDSNGHLNGDEVLKNVAKLIEANLRKVDIVARFGGEEFVILLPEIDKRAALRVAEKLRQAVERHNFPGGENQPGGRLTISLGLAAFPEDAITGEELLETADVALYDAKAAGRNQIAFRQPHHTAGKLPGGSYRLAAAGTRA